MHAKRPQATDLWKCDELRKAEPAYDTHGCGRGGWTKGGKGEKIRSRGAAVRVSG